MAPKPNDMPKSSHHRLVSRAAATKKIIKENPKRHAEPDVNEERPGKSNQQEHRPKPVEADLLNG
jgi:hypothetical protein